MPELDLEQLDKLDAIHRRTDRIQPIKDAIEAERTGIAAISEAVADNQRALRALEGKAEDKTGIAGLKAKVEDNQRAIEALEGKAENQTGIAGLKAKVEDNQRAIEALEGKPENKTGIAGLRAKVEDIQRAIEALEGKAENQTGIAGLKAALEALKTHLDASLNAPRRDDGLVTKADLLVTLDKRRKEQEKNQQWYQDYRLAVITVCVMAAFQMVQIIGYVNDWWR